MHSEEMFALQKDCAERGLFLMRELLPLMGNFARAPGLNSHERIQLGMLLTAAARSSESAFLLIAYGQLWDAEVVVRSTFEASLKFAFIVQKREEFSQRFKEYTEDQFDLSLMKDDQKARDLLSNIPDGDAAQWKPIRDMVLPDAEREKLRERFSRPIRRALETRWGYAGILHSLSNSGDPLYRGFAGLSYSYAIASHIQHADYFGVSIPLDRDARSQERRDSMHEAHLVRLISDCFTCFQFRLRAAYRFVNCDPAPLLDVEKKVEQLMTGMKSAYDRWLDVEYGHSAPKGGSMPG